MAAHAHRAGSRRRAAPSSRASAKSRTTRPAAKRGRVGFRLAPRKATRGRSASRVDWDRFGRIALVVVLFVVIVLYVNPVSNFIDALKVRNAEQQRLADVRAEHDSLTQQAGVLKDPNAAEGAARKLGMVGQGERSYVIRGITP